MKENAWTQAEEARLADDFLAGIELDDIAAALRKTPGSVRWKLTQLGLDVLPYAPPGTPKPQYDEQHLERRRGDLAFKLAMLEAIRTGTERAEPVVIRARVGHYVRRVIPVVESGYRSSAGSAADMGVDNGGTSGQGGNHDPPRPAAGRRARAARRAIPKQNQKCARTRGTAVNSKRSPGSPVEKRPRHGV